MATVKASYKAELASPASLTICSGVTTSFGKFSCKGSIPAARKVRPGLYRRGVSLDRGKTEIGSNDVGISIEGRDVVPELRQVVVLYVLVDCVQLDGKGMDIRLCIGRP